MQRVGSILKRFIGDYGLETGPALTRIKKQWTQLAGQTLASHTFPDVIKGRTIFITVETPQWMHHLSFYRQEIVEKLKPYKIDEVRFRLGKLPETPGYKITAHDMYTLSDEDATYVEDTIKSLKNAELKEKFRLLLTHALRRKKNKRHFF